ncbi:MAG TPA: LysM domain-containing protein [Kiritimatiellia bacterium]|nr:LysM domain-containing protein [Kiritimatiellia bacterium]
MNLDSGGSSMGTYVSTGIAILGVALAGTALYVALNSGKGDARQDDRLSELEQKVDRLTGASEELNGQIRGLYNQTRTSLQNVGEEMNRLRDELKTRPAPVAAAPAAPSVAATTASPASAGGTYTIRAGDLLGKVAHTQGTTVDAILKVNPGLNPNRLKVGQVINLP